MKNRHIIKALIDGMGNHPVLYFDAVTNEVLYDGPLSGLEVSKHASDTFRSARIGYNYDTNSPYVIIKGVSYNG